MLTRKSVLMTGTAIVLIGLSNPAIAQDQSCQQLHQDVRNAAESTTALDSTAETRVNNLLREAGQALGQNNEQECQQKVQEARRILRENGVELAGAGEAAGDSQTNMQVGAGQNQQNAAAPDQESRIAQSRDATQRTGNEADAGGTRSQTAEVGTGAGRIVVEDTPPRVTVDQQDPKVDVTQRPPEITVQQPQPEVIVRQPPPEVTVHQAAPEVTVNQRQPEIIVRIPQPIVTVRMPEADVNVTTPEPNVEVSDTQPNVRFIREEPRIVIEDSEQAKVDVQRGEAQVNVDRTGEPDENVTIEREEAKVEFERTGDPQVSISRAEPNVNVERSGEPNVTIEQEEAKIDYERVEDAAPTDGGPTTGDPSAAQQSGETATDPAQQQQPAEAPAGDSQDQATATDPAQQQQPAEAPAGNSQDQQQPSQDTPAQADSDTQDGQTGQDQQMAAVQQDDASETPASAAGSQMTERMQSHPLFDQPVSALVGQAVYSEQDENIGSLTEIVMQDDQIYGVMSVGGFLGIGARDVAVPFDRIDFRNQRITLQGLTKQQLEDMPQYQAVRYTKLPNNQRVSEAYQNR